MFTLKWNDGMFDHACVFGDRWQRLNSCKAATFRHYNYSSNNALNREVKTETWYLVSYATPIMCVTRRYYVDKGEIIVISIRLNKDAWNCSNTTIKHISRFCNNLNFFYGIDISYHDIKTLVRDSEMYTPHDNSIYLAKPKLEFSKCSDTYMMDLFAKNAPKFGMI